MEITSLQNAKVKEWVKLQEKKYRDETGTFFVEGEHLVQEALKYANVLELISSEEIEIDGIDNYHVTKEIMKKISTQVSPSSIAAVVKKKEDKLEEGPILFLDGLQDAGNIGTIIRSACAFGFKNIVLSLDCCDIYNPKVIRSTEGMLFQVNLLREDTKAFLKEIASSYEIIGTDVEDGTELSKVIIKDKYCIVIGNEGKGMSDIARNYCSNFIYIPMKNTCESLNASVAASIIMYEMAGRK